MRQVGNIKSNQQYNPDEVRHPPPTNTIDGERDSELEKFIRGRWSFLPCKAELTWATCTTIRQVRVQTLRQFHRPSRSICGCCCSSWTFPVCFICQIFLIILESIAVPDTTHSEAFSSTSRLGACFTRSCTDSATKCACRYYGESLCVSAYITSSPVTAIATSCDWCVVRPC